MSAVEIGQMSAAETGQMSSVARTEICLVSVHNVEVSEVATVATSQCLLLKQDRRQMSSGARTDICFVTIQNVQVSEISSASTSQCSCLRLLHWLNTTMFKPQKSQLWQYHNFQIPDMRSGPKSTKMFRNARTRQLTPGHATAVSKPLGLVPRPKSTKIQAKLPINRPRRRLVIW